MPRIHDVGGRPEAGPVDRTPHELADWELLTDAVSTAIGQRGIRTTDEHRRAREDLFTSPEQYASLGYYERWILGNEQVLVEKGLLTHEEVDRKVAELEARWGEP
jgi:nitrile hydratase